MIMLSHEITSNEITRINLSSKRNAAELLGGVTFAAEVESGDFRIPLTRTSRRKTCDLNSLITR